MHVPQELLSLLNWKKSLPFLESYSSLLPLGPLLSLQVQGSGCRAVRLSLTSTAGPQQSHKDPCCRFLEGGGQARLSKVRWKEVTGEWLVTPSPPGSPTGELANDTL